MAESSSTRGWHQAEGAAEPLGGAVLHVVPAAQGAWCLSGMS